MTSDVAVDCPRDGATAAKRRAGEAEQRAAAVESRVRQLGAQHGAANAHYSDPGEQDMGQLCTLCD